LNANADNYMLPSWSWPALHLPKMPLETVTEEKAQD